MILSQAKSIQRGPAAPMPRLSLGVTGHRNSNAAYAAHEAQIAAQLAIVFDAIERARGQATLPAGSGPLAQTRLHSLLVDGLDQLAVRQALGRHWHVVSPLPFGRVLNNAINALPTSPSDARALLTGQGTCTGPTRTRWQAIEALMDQAHVFERADQDPLMAQLFLAALDDPDDPMAAQAYRFTASQRVALAARVMIEQSDFLIGVWDGVSTSFAGGTGHTIALALDMGVPVIWIDATQPQHWTVLETPEDLAGLPRQAQPAGAQEQRLIRLVQDALQLREADPAGHNDAKAGMEALEAETWRARSNPWFHLYRRVEALFGAERLKDRFRGLSQTYEPPDAIEGGSGASLLNFARTLPSLDASYVTGLVDATLKRFAWADGISSHLSDAYRGGMMLSFVFSACAIVGGLAYLPLASSDEKWMFAIFELVLLAGILLITFVGQSRRWHGRWFETRRVAEYFRHAPILMLLGVARPSGRWPQGAATTWPEWYARHSLRALGLPRVQVTPDFLRHAVTHLLGAHVAQQRDYHIAKARRLARAHRRLDALSETLFTLAVPTVSVYLILKGGALLALWPMSVPSGLSKLFTFLGVMLPTFGGAIAGMRYFGDFERFSAISNVTAAKLDLVASRINRLAAGPDQDMTYARVSALAHLVDDIVFDEIESWQAVFSGKHITVPV